MANTTGLNSMFSGTAPELDWATYNKYILGDYLKDGFINHAEKRSKWTNSLGLDLGGKYSTGIEGFDWTSFNQGEGTGNLDDMGLPTYGSNPNVAADREAAIKKYLSDPNTVYSINTDRINADGSTKGGLTRSAVRYRRVGNKLVPIDQRDFTNSSDTTDFLTGLAAFGAVAGGGALLGAGEAGGAGAAAGAGGATTSGATNAALIDSALGTAGYGASSAGAGGVAATAGGGLNSIFNEGLPKMSTGNSFIDKILSNVTQQAFGGGSGGISNIGNLGSLFSNYKQYDQNKDLINEIKGVYSPDGAYAKALESKLARRDSAAGRNSQYGPRLAEMLGMLGDSQARALSGLGGFMGQQQGGLNGMLGAGQRLLSGFDLNKLFQGGMGGLSNEWALGPNAGPSMPLEDSDIWDLFGN